MALKVSLKFDSWCRRRPCRDCCCCCYYYRYHPTTTTTTLDAASRVLVCSSTHSTTTTLFVQRSVVVVVVPSSSSSSSNSRSRQKRLQPSPPSRSSLFLFTSLFVSSSLVFFLRRFFLETAVWFARPPCLWVFLAGRGLVTMLLWCWCCLWGLSLLLSFVFFLTLRSISRFLKKIDRSIDRSKECCDVVGSKTKKQNIPLFFFFACVCVWRKHHHNHNHSITFYQKLQNFIKDDSSDDDSSDDGLVATRAKDTARARERGSRRV